MALWAMSMLKFCLNPTPHKFKWWEVDRYWINEFSNVWQLQDFLYDQSARELEAEYPGRVLLIRYEDLSLYPTYIVKSILKFLDLPEKKEIMDYIQTHTNKDRPVISRNKKTKKVNHY